MFSVSEIESLSSSMIDQIKRNIDKLQIDF